jgi:hypothetical protein
MPSDQALKEARELREQIESVAAEVAALRLEVPAEPMHLDDGARERMEAQFAEMTDAQAVDYLLGIHKLTEIHSTGKATLLAEGEAHAIILTLLRVAPEALADGLALYMEGVDDEDDASEGSRPEVCANCGRARENAERGWRAYLTDDTPPSVEVFCPECAEEEFGDA